MSMFATLEVEALGDEVAAGAVLSVCGELDIAAAPRLRVAIGDLMGQGVRHVEVDLDGCSFLDSSGVGALLWAAHRLRAVGGDLIALNVHGSPARTLEMSHVDSVVPVRH
jgi:anti-anti-sigma factor